MINKALLENYRIKLETQSASEVLAWAKEIFGDKQILATSLGAEDQVLTHLIDKNDLGIRAFMLDTGRHFEETYELLQRTRAAYAVDIELYFPETAAVEAMVREHGPYSFRKEIALRKQCCGIRKIQPLKRALEGKRAWITGLRRDQATTRQALDVIEWDESNGLLKINPLWNWSEADVWNWIRDHNVPYNALHDKQFPSIGCAPCTRAIEPGEDVRAGRWWWERPEQKECGLHWVDGRPVRIKQAEAAPQPLFEEVGS